MIEKITNAKIINYPWPHKIIDDFLPESMVIKIKENYDAIFKYCAEKKTYAVMMDEFISVGGDEHLVEEIVDFCDMLIKNIKEIIGENDTNNFTSGNYFIMPKFGVTGKNYIEDIHDENPFKVLNIVVYLHPEESEGTRLFTNNSIDSYVTSIEWKENRAFLTYPIKGKSWHNWQHLNSDIPRITLNMFFEKMEGFPQAVDLHDDDKSKDTALWMFDQFGKEKLTVII